MVARDARTELLRLINGFQASQAIHVAATLGLADLLGSGPKNAAELAAATGTYPPALYRLMRALASIGVFQEQGGRQFALTAVGEFLRNDITGTHAPMAELIGRKNLWHAWGDLLYAVRSGATAFDHVHGSGVWEFRAKSPEEARIFDRAMCAGTERFAEAVIDVCDFGRFQHLVDIGGGDGVFLVKALTAFPQLRGTLFDQPQVAVRAATSIEAHGLDGRCRTVGGNFFVGVPEGADAYLLKWILHDWDDVASIDILRSCRKAMTPTGTLLVVEHIIGSPNTSHEGTFMDLTMMVLTGGRERTRDEFAALLAEAGFRLVAVTPTGTPLSLIEGVPETV